MVGFVVLVEFMYCNSHNISWVEHKAKFTQKATRPTYMVAWRIHFCAFFHWFGKYNFQILLQAAIIKVQTL